MRSGSAMEVTPVADGVPVAVECCDEFGGVDESCKRLETYLCPDIHPLTL
jgi:hypothetical protein